jgi:hypothetical protein
MELWRMHEISENFSSVFRKPSTMTRIFKAATLLSSSPTYNISSNPNLESPLPKKMNDLQKLVTTQQQDSSEKRDPSQEFDDYLSLIITRIIRTTEVLAPKYWDILIFSLLKELMRLIPETAVNLNEDSQFTCLFSACLTNYLLIYLGPKPSPSHISVRDWEIRHRHAKSQIESLGIKELKDFLPNRYGRIVSLDVGNLKPFNGVYYSRIYDEAEGKKLSAKRKGVDSSTSGGGGKKVKFEE